MIAPALSNVLRALLAVGAMAVVLRQFRKPFGWPGRLVLGVMNLRHAAVTAWGLGHLSIGRDAVVLDIGCGGGRTIARLAELAGNGKVYGVDHSAASVAAASRLNAGAIEEGRVEIRNASVSRLPFPDEAFDLVTAVETHYYWPEPVADLREVLRVLKPGGRLLLIAEAHEGERLGWLFRPALRLLGGAYLTASAHRELLAGAGYGDIEIDTDRRRGWLCGVGRRPTTS